MPKSINYLIKIHHHTEICFDIGYTQEVANEMNKKLHKNLTKI